MNMRQHSYCYKVLKTRNGEPFRPNGSMLKKLVTRASLVFVAITANASGPAQPLSSEAADKTAVVAGPIVLNHTQEDALTGAVDAYRALGIWWQSAVKCDLRQLCQDELFSVQITPAYAQLYFSQANQQSVKVASFPLDTIQAVSLMSNKPAASPAEISYFKLQRFLAVIGRKATQDRQILYSFPNGNDNPFLPWPPRMPTQYEDVSINFDVQGTLGTIVNQIRAKISTRGYDNLRYFSVPGGFAVATDVERVGRHGAIAAADRWTNGKRGGLGSLFDYWRRLLAGEDDRFRVFVMIVTDADLQNDPNVANAEDLRGWKARGRPALSRERAAALALPGTRVWLYVYEFDASKSKGTELVQNERDPLSIRADKEALGLR